MTKFIRKQVGRHPKADLFRLMVRGTTSRMTSPTYYNIITLRWSYGWDGEDGGYRLVLNLWGMEAASD